MTSDFTLCSCPECFAVAESYDPALMRSTDGPVLMVHVRCLNGHQFFMPAEQVPGLPEEVAHEHT